MENMKRTLSWLLSFVMVIGLLAGIPMPAKAADADFTYDFSTFSGSSTQYANETHDLGSNVSLNIVSCHINSQLRIYSSTTNNGIAVFSFPSKVASFTINAGNKADTLNIYGSTDGTSWTENTIATVATASTYQEYTVTLDGTYQYLKLDVAGTSQVRIKTVSVTYAADSGDSGEPACEHPNATSEVTTPATCNTAGVTTWTCPDCDAAPWTEAAPAATGVHTYVNDICTVCGIQELDGKNVVIYAPAYNMAFSATKTGNYNVGVAVTVTDGVMNGYGTTETWTVTKNDDGTYSFANGGLKIGMALDYASMNLDAIYNKWELIYLGNGLYNIKNVGRGNYMEWYASKDNWSTYNSTNAATDDQFQLSFYVIPADACTHENATSEVTTPVSCNFDGEKTWTCECGYSWTEAIEATGHTFENDVCTVCNPTNIPTAPADILTAANALVAGDSLPYLVTLTGQIVSVDTAYSEQYGNITVTIQVSDSETSLQCYRLTATDADLTDDLAALAVGQIITVKGELMNYNGNIQFGAGSLLLAVEAAPTYTISFVVPSGVTAIPSQENDVALPEAGAPEGYTFLGWTTATIDNVTDKPDYYEAGEILALIDSDITLNALYSQVQGGGSSSDVVFEFGDNDTSKENSESSSAKESYSETVGDYTFSFTDGVKTYPGSYDINGNSVLKLATSSATASFSFTVPADVSKVIIKVSGRQTKTVDISVNGTTYNISTSSNTAYTDVEVDTSTDKTVEFATLASGADERAYIDSITYVVGDAGTTYYTTVISAQEEPVEFKFASASLTLEEGISVNFKVDKAVIEKYEPTGLTIEINDTTYSYALTDAKIVDEQYIFTLYNIRPDWMTKTITATMTADGQEAAVLTYSIRQYCDNMLAKYPNNTALITLLTDLLTYGAKAQAYTGSNDALATEGWNGAGTTATPSTTPIAAFENNGDVKWASAALFLRETTRLRFTVTTDYAEAMVVKYTIGNGAEQTIDLAAGTRAFFIDGLTTLQMRTDVSVTVCDAQGNALSGELVYQVQNYVANVANDALLSDMMNAMINFGDAAIAYAAAN